MVTRAGDELPRGKCRPGAAADVSAHLRRLEALARRLLSMKFDGAQGLWEVQLDLLKAQQEIQADIQKAKRRSSGAERRATLEALRWARWHARTLGDTFAWLVLGLDRQVIHALGANSRVGVHAARHGDEGAIAIAQYLANQGLGFPLLHDVTDCLRIGDITFVRPDANGGKRERKLYTVEAKTRVVDERPCDDGKTEYQYQVQITGFAKSPDEFPEIVRRQDEHSPDPAPAASAPARPDDPRHRRQLRRMGNAMTRQDAPEGEVVELEGEPPLLNVRFESSAATYWPQLRRAIREARKSGLATEMVEPGMLIAAIYGEGGISADSLKELPQPDLRATEMFPPHLRDENAVIIHAVPADDPGRMNLFLPYFLYGVPKRAIFDILRGRLVVAVIVNPAFIFRDLRRNGFEIRRKGSHPAAAVVSAQVTLDDGSTYRADLHNLGYYLNEIVYEFKGFEYISETARSLRDSMSVAIQHARSSARTQQRQEELDQVVDAVRYKNDGATEPPVRTTPRSA